MYPFEIWQDPGNHKWFITFGGLMDTDAGWFNTKEEAYKTAVNLVK